MAFVGIYLLAADNGENLSLLGVLGKYELLAIFGAMLGGAALVAVKKLHDTDSSYAIYFAQCVVGLWVVVVPANVVPCSIGISGGLLLVAIERPAYLGAIQAFSVYEPHFCPVPLAEDGVDAERLRDVLAEHPIKLFHTVINFQTPSGITYSQGKRKELTELFVQYDTVGVEDDSYLFSASNAVFEAENEVFW